MSEGMVAGGEENIGFSLAKEFLYLRILVSRASLSLGSWKPLTYSRNRNRLLVISLGPSFLFRHSSSHHHFLQPNSFPLIDISLSYSLPHHYSLAMKRYEMGPL